MASNDDVDGGNSSHLQDFIDAAASLRPRTSDDADWTDETGDDEDDMGYEPTIEESDEDTMHQFFEQLLEQEEGDEEEEEDDEDDEIFEGK